MQKALLFGSIGVLVETSDLQRRAFNRAFAEAGLDWVWDEGEYRKLLTRAGGADRVARYAAGRGETVDAAGIHRSKSLHFRELLRSEPLSLRPGVASTLAAAERVALVSTTSPENVGAVIAALSPAIRPDRFEVIVDRSRVERPKPAPDAYHFALSHMRLQPSFALAIEDNPPGAEAARAAGLNVIAFPGAMHVDHDFGPVTARVSRLALEDGAAAA